MSKVIDAAIAVMKKRRKKTIWYGNVDLVHDIADVANVQGKHPTNVKASIMSVIGKSDSVILSGKIEHNGRYHNVYEIVAKRRIKPRLQRRPNKTPA